MTDKYQVAVKIVLLTIIAFVLPIFGEEKSTKPASDHGQAQGFKEPTSTSRHIVVIEQEHPADQSNTPKDHSKNYLRELFSANNLPNILLFLAGLGGIAVGVYTLRDIRTQTRLLGEYVTATKAGVEATGKSADAAFLNAQAVINAERPWLMIQIEETMVDKGERDSVGIFSLRSFQFTVFNYGKTPAHIISCKGPKIEFYRTPDKDLPIPPDYGDWSWDKKFLAPKDSLPIGTAIYPSDKKMSQRVEGDLVAYGLIEYRDGISAKDYKTAFCYRHEKMPLSSMGGHFVVCGPSVYNQYT